MSLQDQATELPTRLAELGIRIPEGSRFFKYAEILSPSPSGSTVKTSADEDWDETKQGCVDVPQMSFILDQLPEHNRGDWLARIKKAIGGQIVADPIIHTHLPEQNVQFELYTAARLQKAGVFSSFGEPDVIAQIDGEETGFACKQLMSIEGQIEKRVGSARDQILKSGIPGVIVLELTLGLNRSRDVLGSDLDASTMMRRTSAFYGAFREHYLPLFRRWTRQSSWVRGVLVVENLLHFTGGCKYKIINCVLDFPLVIYNTRRQRHFTTIYDTFMEGGIVQSKRIPAPSAYDQSIVKYLVPTKRRN